MSAETLRRAASLMRERAEAATPGPWAVVPGASNVWRFPDEGTPTVIVPGNGSQGRRVKQADAEHIAAMDPTLALLLAKWLDTAADRDPTGQAVESEPALDLARTYLKEER